MIPMRYLVFIFGLILFSTGLISCSPGGEASLLASESLQEKQIFCNPFNDKGFEGVISVYAGEVDVGPYKSDSARLIFYDVPSAFEYQRNSYIQLFLVNYVDNSARIDDEPLDLDVLDLRTHSFSRITNYVDHQMIQDEGVSLVEFLADYSLLIKDVVGWQAVLIGLFNEQDDVIEQTKVLIPPFEVNPYLYQMKYSKSDRLVKLHPFYDLINVVHEEDNDVFLSKAENACDILL